MPKTVVVRPAGALPDNVGRMLESLASLPRPPLASATEVTLRFGVPRAGWIDFELRVGAQQLTWDLSYAPDPFRIEPASGDVEYSLVAWLERVVRGDDPALFVDMEGPCGMLVAERATGDDVNLVGFTDGEGITVHTQMDRLGFVAAFYRQLLAYWESDAFVSHWEEWSRGEKKWSLRSNIIEQALTAQGR